MCILSHPLLSTHLITPAAFPAAADFLRAVAATPGTEAVMDCPPGRWECLQAAHDVADGILRPYEVCLADVVSGYRDHLVRHHGQALNSCRSSHQASSSSSRPRPCSSFTTWWRHRSSSLKGEAGREARRLHASSRQQAVGPRAPVAPALGC